MAHRKKKHGGGGGLQALLNPGGTLSGKSLLRGAKSLTKLSLRPQISEYERLAHQLQQQGLITGGGLEKLGNRTTGNVGNVYRTMAQSAAEGLARQNAIANTLQQRTTQVGNQQQAALQSGQQGQLGDYLEGLQMRGAPGGGAAQQALADQATAEQGRMAAAQSNASNLANQLGSSYGSYATGQVTANQQRGSESQANIQRDIASRIAQNALRSAQDVAEAKGKASDIRALKGPQTIQNLLNLRESERNFMLSGSAVGMDQAKLAEQAREFNQEARQRGHGKWTGGSGSSSSNPHKVDQSVISSAIQQAIAKGGGAWPAPGNRKQRAQFTEWVLGAEGVKPEWKKAVNRRIRRALSKHGWG